MLYNRYRRPDRPMFPLEFLKGGMGSDEHMEAPACAAPQPVPSPAPKLFPPSRNHSLPCPQTVPFITYTIMEA